MRVLGIDPGIASCGWALLRLTHGQKPRCEASGTWTTAPADGDDAKRISGIGTLFSGVARGVDLIAIEAWSFQRTRGKERRANSKAGTTVPRVIERLRTIADMRNIPCVEVHQQTAKSALGVRTKDGVKRAVAVLVDCERPTVGKHAVDAIAAGIAGARKWTAEGAMR